MKKIAVASILAVIGLAARANAAPITYTCPAGSSECAGNTFAVFTSNETSTSFDISISINTSGYTGSGFLASGVEIKSITGSNDPYTDFALTAAPGNTTLWDAAQAGQLSQQCDTTPGDLDTACAYWADDPNTLGYSFSKGDTLTWTFHIGGTLADNTVHIKYLFQNADGQPTGGLLSKDITLQHNCTIPGGCDVTVTPEPATLLLFGAGLAGIARTQRRRKPRSN